MKKAIQLDAIDNVATVIDEQVQAGSEVAVGGAGAAQVKALDAIAFGHKIALRDVAAGEPIVKYGEVIGHASQSVRAGEHVHSHNLQSDRARGDRGARSRA